MTATRPAATESGRFDRAEWLLIAVSFLGISVVFGCCRFTYSIVITPMRAELGAARETMALLAMANLVGYMVGSVVAAANGRHARRIVVPALVVCTTCLVLLTVSASVRFTLLVLVVLGLASGLAFVSLAGLLSTAFSVDRGRAVGLAMAGIGAGICASSLVAAALLDWADSGWRWVWLVVGVYTGVVTVAAAWVYPQFVPPAADSEEPVVAGVVARADPRRWFLFAAYLAWGFGQVIQITLLPDFLAEERHVDVETASLVYGVSGVSMFLASPLVGVASDRIGRRVMYAACLSCAVAGLALVLLGGTVAAYVTGSFLFGVPVSGLGALTPALVADLWRPEQFAAVFGGMTALFGIVQSSGPSLAALSIASTGSLEVAYAGSLVFCVLGLLSVAGLPATRRRSTASPTTTPPAAHPI